MGVQRNVCLCVGKRGVSVERVCVDSIARLKMCT